MDANASPVTVPGFSSTRRPMRRLSIAALLTLLLVGSVQAASPRLASEAEGYAPEGSCAGCHQAEHDAWKDSDHGWAMRPATPDNVLGDFADARFTDSGQQGEIQALFHRQGERFLVTLEGPGEPEATHEIAYTFGYYPLQQYLIEMPGGRLQGLTIAWDSRSAAEGGQRWFSLYPGQTFTPDDPLHWQGRYQNWNAMCADCHSTNLQKGYGGGRLRHHLARAERRLPELPRPEPGASRLGPGSPLGTGRCPDGRLDRLERRLQRHA